MTDNASGGAGGTRGADEWPEPGQGADDWPEPARGAEDWPEPGQGAEGMWRPVPHGGEYDAEATAFVQLPPEDDADAPLAAPGHGYVPPMITPLQPDPSVAGTWGLPDPQVEAGQQYPGTYGQDPYAPQDPGAGDQDPQGAGGPQDPQQYRAPYGSHDPYAQAPYGQAPYGQAPYGHAPYGQGAPAHDPYGQGAPAHGAAPHDPQAHDPHAGAGQGHEAPAHDPGATGHWNFTAATDAPGGARPEAPDPAGHGAADQAPAPEAPAQQARGEGTGQWRIPLATGEVTDESGELSAALAASPWNGGVTPPATLPGGARAPWAPEPEPAPAP
ncbi:hypothetical protein L1885_27280, partial [Streptomyces fuscigenes]|nr:hypothetical protein [Streptomyces fuscigenes]